MTGLVYNAVVVEKPVEPADDALILERLYNSPRLPELAAAISAHMADETSKRRAFYARRNERESVEFINGETVYHAPRPAHYQQVVSRLRFLLEAYVNARRLGIVARERQLITLVRNDYEPDICFYRSDRAKELAGRKAQLPAPDLVIEVLSPGTEARDRGIKYVDYALHGVEEYWLIDPDKEVVEQYRLGDAAYELIMKARTGELTSGVLDGFTIPVRAIFDPDVHRATLQSTLAGTE